MISSFVAVVDFFVFCLGAGEESAKISSTKKNISKLVKPVHAVTCIK